MLAFLKLDYNGLQCFNRAVKKWFVTWNRPEYKEWATPAKEGYLLIVIRKEKDKYLCVKAKLIMGEKGLPAFEILEEKYFLTSQQATKQIGRWKSNLPLPTTSTHSKKIVFDNKSI